MKVTRRQLRRIIREAGWVPPHLRGPRSHPEGSDVEVNDNVLIEFIEDMIGSYMEDPGPKMTREEAKKHIIALVEKL